MTCVDFPCTVPANRHNNILYCVIGAYNMYNSQNLETLTFKKGDTDSSWTPGFKSLARGP